MAKKKTSSRRRSRSTIEEADSGSSKPRSRTRTQSSEAESPSAPEAPEEPREDPTVPVRTVAPAVAAAVSRTPIASVAITRDSVSSAVFLEAIEHGISKRTARAIAEDIADRLRLAGDECPDKIPEAGFYDLRAEQDYVYPRGKNKVRKRGNSVVMRDPKSVTTIVVHQTAIEFGVSKLAIAHAGRDVELARARRALDVACHAMAFRQGYFVAAHPLRAYVNHGNRFNAYSLGLEIDGRYAGVADNPATAPREDLLSTWGGKPTELTDQTVRAACAALQWLVVEGRKIGMPLQNVVSHRQSSDMRRSDPGEGIWKRVVLDCAVDELGLTPVLESNWREGLPVPVEWDANGIGHW